MIDLNDIGACRDLSRRIKADINDYCVKAYEDDARRHLGASIIGHECARYIWYGFRWMFRPTFDGRMYRLFNRGHREEERFIEWLRGTGNRVSDVTETGEQHRIEDVGGHFGGSMDSKVWLAEHYGIRPDQACMVGEFKTHNYKSFSKFTAADQTHSVKEVQPKHYAQMSVYGYKQQCQFGIYLPISKNDDDIEPEIIKLDWGYAQDLIRKGEHIINSMTPPPRIAANPNLFTCKFCDANDICWHGKKLWKNCRSCVFSQPTENKQWGCNKFGQLIPPDFIPKGCDQWSPIGQ